MDRARVVTLSFDDFQFPFHEGGSGVGPRSMACLEAKRRKVVSGLRVWRKRMRSDRVGLDLVTAILLAFAFNTPCDAMGDVVESFFSSLFNISMSWLTYCSHFVTMYGFISASNHDVALIITLGRLYDPH